MAVVTAVVGERRERRERRRRRGRWGRIMFVLIEREGKWVRREEIAERLVP